MPHLRTTTRGNRVAAIRERFENPFQMVCLTCETFHEMLPDPADRAAFAAAFPEEFWSTFEAVADPQAEKFVTTACVAAGCCVFRRPLGFYRRLRPKAPFAPPDLRNIRYCEHQLRMAQARAAFWRANGLKMTAAELEWIDHPPRPKTDHENTIRMKGNPDD